jgi:hypothetical protein
MRLIVETAFRDAGIRYVRSDKPKACTEACDIFGAAAFRCRPSGAAA